MAGYAHRFYYVTWRDMLGVPEWPQEQETPQEPAVQTEQDPEAGAEMQAADGADPAGTEPDPAAQEPAGSEPEETAQQPESGAQTPTALSQLDAAALEHTACASACTIRRTAISCACRWRGAEP